MVKQAITFLAVCAFVATTCSCSQKEHWIPLFNGKNLDGWTPKIKGYPYGNNHNNTFIVEDSVLKVSYKAYDSFHNAFGHLFYKTPYSNYKFRMEYRFTGAQIAGGRPWAIRNSGIMIHCEDPKHMDLEQNFPVSIEVQLLYNKPHIGGGAVNTGDKWKSKENFPLKGGYISLQSESHPVEFKNIEILNLD